MRWRISCGRTMRATYTSVHKAVRFPSYFDEGYLANRHRPASTPDQTPRSDPCFTSLQHHTSIHHQPPHPHPHPPWISSNKATHNLSTKGIANPTFACSNLPSPTNQFLPAHQITHRPHPAITCTASTYPFCAPLAAYPLSHSTGKRTEQCTMSTSTIGLNMCLRMQ